MTAVSEFETRSAAGGASLHIEDLWKVYGSRPAQYLAEFRAGVSAADGSHMVAVRGCSFDVKPGETFVVMGLSGSGKSTLVRCLNRLLEPTSGIVEIDGVDVVSMSRSQLTRERRTNWAMVFQHFGLLPHRSVLHNAAYGLEVGGVSRPAREQRAREVLELVGLTAVAQRFPNELSGGMQQRVGLARALAVSPRLMLLDEPFSALDPLIRSDLQDELIRLAQVVNQTSVFITHDLAEALKVGDRIAIMRDGEFVQVGTPEEIVLRPADDYVRRFALEAPRAKVVKAGTIAVPVLETSADRLAGDVLSSLSRANAAAAVLPDHRAGSEPIIISEMQLLRGCIGGQTIGELCDDTPRCRSVRPDDTLGDVLEILQHSGGPVAVRPADTPGVIGVIDDSAVVRALGTPPHVSPGAQ